VENIGSEIVEVTEDVALQQLGMKPGDAVDGVAANHGEVGHPDRLITRLVDQRHTPKPVEITREGVVYLLEEAPVDLVDDLEVARQHPREERERPLLERFRQTGYGLCSRGSARVMLHASSHSISCSSTSRRINSATAIDG
jgi:hypothetical protein